MDQKIYNSLFKHLDYEINKRGLKAEPSEVISEAYLQLSEQGAEVSYNNLRERCRGIMFKKPEFYVYKGEKLTRQTSKVCAKCNQDTPFGFFGSTIRSKNDTKEVQPYCRDCAKEYMREYFEKNRLIVNDKMRERYRYGKENLSDAYIKRVLRRCGWATEDITTNTVSYKRKELENLPKGNRLKNKIKLPSKPLPAQ